MYKSESKSSPEKSIHENNNNNKKSNNNKKGQKQICQCANLPHSILAAYSNKTKIRKVIINVTQKI